MPDLSNKELTDIPEENKIPPAENEALSDLPAPAAEPAAHRTLAEAVGAKLARRPAAGGSPGPLAVLKTKLSGKKAPAEPELPPELLAIKEGPRTGQDSEDGLTEDEDRKSVV